VGGFEKRGNCTFSKISTLNANNFDAIVAMNLKLAKIILYSFCYTRYESKPRPFPVWAWRVRILPVVENRPFYTFSLTATTSDRRLSTASNVGFVKQKV